MRFQSRHALRSFIVACIVRKGERSMLQPSQETNIRELEGVIQQVDPVSREVVVQHDGQQISFYVPIDCKILLNDERVKLRMLQPMDQVYISFTRVHSHFVAHSIEMHWDSPAPRIAPSDAAFQHAVNLMECT
jgi:hypothetical protein